MNFHSAINKARLDVAKHLGKEIVLNGQPLKVPFVTTEGGASMGGYRRQPLSEQVILLTETQADTVTSDMTVTIEQKTFVTTHDPSPRADGWFEVSLREVFE